jgi:hypothetical protein
MDGFLSATAVRPSVVDAKRSRQDNCDDTDLGTDIAAMTTPAVFVDWVAGLHRA